MVKIYEQVKGKVEKELKTLPTIEIDTTKIIKSDDIGDRRKFINLFRDNK
jgi:hypothetical protein